MFKIIYATTKSLRTLKTSAAYVESLFLEHKRIMITTAAG